MGSSTAGARRAWLSAALLSLSLLVVPLVVWLLLPRPAPIAPPRRAPATAAPSPRPTPPAPAEAQDTRTTAPPSPPPPPQVEPAAASAAAVRGLVLDPEGRPSAGAFIACNEPLQHLSATTDADGRFEMRSDADGCTAVATQSHNVSEPTRLAAGSENVLRLRGGGGIEGTVVDEGGRPVEAYLLAIESYVPSGSQVKAPISGRARKVFDQAGAFLWEDLAPGRYVLTASSAGRPPARSSSLDVEAGRTTRNVRIVLPRGVTLKGRVIDADSRQPIAGAQVELDAATSSGANAISLVLSDENGGYELEGVPGSGPFSVRASHQSYVSRIVPGLDARGASSLRADIELRARGDGGTREELSGIGATLMASAKGVILAAVLDGGPAARAGLERGDRIVRIDGADASELPVSDCIQRLRGQPGTRVSVAVEREGQTLELTLQREIVVR